MRWVIGRVCGSVGKLLARNAKPEGQSSEQGGEWRKEGEEKKKKRGFELCFLKSRSSLKSYPGVLVMAQ